MIRVDRTAASQHFLPQSVEQACEAVLDIIGPLHTHAEVSEPSPVQHTHALQVHDVLEHKPAAATQAMGKCEPHLHAVILAAAIGLIPGDVVRLVSLAIDAVLGNYSVLRKRGADERRSDCHRLERRLWTARASIRLA
jgi:hypothetical protein